MCMGTKIKHVSAIGSALAVIISIVTLLSLVFGWIGNTVLADEKVKTLRDERTGNKTEYQNIKDCIAEMKTDMAVVKNDTARIKEHLKSNR